MNDGIVSRAHGRQFSGGIGVRQAAADGAAVARLAMADMTQGFRQQRTMLRDLGRGLEFALAHHGADAQPAVDHRNAAQISDAAEVDQMIGHDVAKIHHRHQRLPAGQNLGVGQRGQQLGGLLELPRRMIVERSRLHFSRARLADPVQWKGRKLLQKWPVLAVTDPSIEAW